MKIKLDLDSVIWYLNYSYLIPVAVSGVTVTAVTLNGVKCLCFKFLISCFSMGECLTCTT